MRCLGTRALAWLLPIGVLRLTPNTVYWLGWRHNWAIEGAAIRERAGGPRDRPPFRLCGAHVHRRVTLPWEDA